MKRALTLLLALALLGAAAWLILPRLLPPAPVEAPAKQPAVSEAALPYTEIGGTVVYGRYEQNGDEADGPEPVEWIVLDSRGGRSLLISRFGLDAMAYKAPLAAATWETSGIRQWLNTDFLAAAFTEEEQAAVLTVTVDNGRQQSIYRKDGGAVTEDRVFLLSDTEVLRYFPVRKSRACTPTAYALSRGAYRHERYDDGWWWLRSPGRSATFASCVNYLGTFYHNHVHNTYDMVRPAFWIDLGKLSP